MTTKVVISGDSSGAVKAIERVRKELGALDSVSKAAFSLGGAISAATTNFPAFKLRSSSEAGSVYFGA